MNAPVSFPMGENTELFSVCPHRAAICPRSPRRPRLSRPHRGPRLVTMKSLPASSTERPTGQIVPGHRPFVTVGEALLSAVRNLPRQHPLSRAAKDLERP